MAHIYDVILLRTYQKEFKAACQTMEDAFQHAVKLFDSPNEYVMNVNEKRG